MSKNAKLRRKVDRLERENLSLIIEVNAAMVRAGEAHEALFEAVYHTSNVLRARYGVHPLSPGELDG